MGRMPLLALLAMSVVPTVSTACTAPTDGIDDTFRPVLTDEMLEVPVVAKVKILTVADEVIPYLDDQTPFVGRVEVLVVEGIKGVEAGSVLSVAWLPEFCPFEKPEIGASYFVAGKQIGEFLWGVWPDGYHPNEEGGWNEWLWHKVEQEMLEKATLDE